MWKVKYCDNIDRMKGSIKNHVQWCKNKISNGREIIFFHTVYKIIQGKNMEVYINKRNMDDVDNLIEKE